MSALSELSKVGAQFGPWGAAAGAGAGLVADLAGSGDAAPSSATQNGATSGMFDSSNWNVNFSGTQSNTTTRSGAQQAGAQAPDLLDSMTGGQSSGVLWLAAAVIGGALLWKKKS